MLSPKGRDLRVRSADSGDGGLKVCEESRKTQPSRKGTRVRAQAGTRARAQAGVPRKQEGISAKGEMQRKRKRTPARGGGRVWRGGGCLRTRPTEACACAHGPPTAVRETSASYPTSRRLTFTVCKMAKTQRAPHRVGNGCPVLATLKRAHPARYFHHGHSPG